MAANPAKNKEKTWVFFFLFLLFFAYYFQGIGNIGFTYWDEAIYINAARAYFVTGPPYPNPEHPPFGKILLALGMNWFGDNPTGWRFFSVFFGALTTTLVSLIVYRLTKNLGVALFVAFLLFLDPLWVVHFRMGMLDAPITALLVLAALWTVSFFEARDPPYWKLILITATLGLATSIKLLTLIMLPAYWGLIVYRHWGRPHPIKNITLVSALFAGVIPLVFFWTFWVMGYSLAETVDLVRFNFAYHETAVGPAPFFSRWFEWLYIKNPVWYHTWLDGKGMGKGIMATGNFVLWIGAEIGTAYALIRKRRSPVIWFLFSLIAIQFLVYTQKHSTYIHYMTEILPFLYILMGVAIGDLFKRYGSRYGTLLRIDFAIFALGALVVFWNIHPYVWGKLVPAEKMRALYGLGKIPSPKTPETQPETQAETLPQKEQTQGQEEKPD
ncbi:MAG: phospholipid carrier-dependent glycosyltransferase [bacterium]|nr:phospholipid carrier-dependent glycosyltransferase [bacterium]